MKGRSHGSYHVRMLRIGSVLLFSVAIIACSKSKSNDAPSTGSSTAAGSATSGSGSADGSGATKAGSAEGSGSAAMAGSADGSAAEGSAAGSGSVVATSDFDFDKLSHDEQVKFMKTKVMPVMKPAFQKFDPKEYRSFTCKTCHGKDPKKVKYKMPNPELPALDFEAIKAGKVEPTALEFMSKTVKPEMARLLDLPEMSETVHDGFGCLACHTMKKK